MTAPLHARTPSRARWARLALGLVAAAALCGTPALAQLEKKKALRPQQKTCLDCHSREAAAFRSRASVHPPVREGRCESCHLRHGVVGVLRLSAEDPDLCLACHTAEAGGRKEKAAGATPAGPVPRPLTFTHPPAGRLKCGACHDPHGSGRPDLLKGDARTACLACHDAAAFQGASAHSPAAADCLTCHLPHGTGAPGSLRKAAAELCVSCHDGRSPAEQRGHGGGRPGGASCLSCHAPHASPAAGLLRRRAHAPMAEVPEGCGACHVAGSGGDGRFPLIAAVPDLCLTCHDDPRTTTPGTGPAGKTGVHEPVAGGDCLTCHAPHASDHSGLLKEPMGALCGTCHDEARAAAQAKVPHAPALQQCTACHLAHAGPAKLLKAPPPGLCGTCHAEVAKEIARAHPHPPAAAGECLVCHDPHGSGHPGALQEAASTLCATCHEGIDKELAERFPHPPVRAGQCVACHEPHGAAGEHLVRADPGAACLKCHADQAAAYPEAGRHAPFAAGECLACHRPHSAPRENLLRSEPGALCRTCHEEVQGERGATLRHPPVTRGQCLSCHGPHGGHPPALLRLSDSRTLCLSCHAEEGKTLARRDLTVHPPFRQGPCLVCHTPHASIREGLLAKEPAALCATCHDPARREMTVAHKGLVRSGTDCTSCHEAHASEGRHLVLPIQHPPFAEGECAACHQGEAP